MPQPSAESVPPRRVMGNADGPRERPLYKVTLRIILGRPVYGVAARVALFPLWMMHTRIIPSEEQTALRPVVPLRPMDIGQLPAATRSKGNVTQGALTAACCRGYQETDGCPQAASIAFAVAISSRL